MGLGVEGHFQLEGRRVSKVLGLTFQGGRGRVKVVLRPIKVMLLFSSAEKKWGKEGERELEEEKKKGV